MSLNDLRECQRAVRVAGRVDPAADRACQGVAGETAAADATTRSLQEQLDEVIRDA